MPTRLARLTDRLAAHLSAKQTAAVCLCGGLISATGCLAELLMRSAKPHHPNTAFWIWTAISFALMILGFAIAFFARSEIESGIANDRWPEAEVQSLRNLARSPFAMAICVALFIAMTALLVVHPRYTSAFWACFILLQIFSQLSWATRPPPATPTSWLGASTARWQDETASLTPIQSNHWGSR